MSQNLEELTVEELQDIASEREISGRSSMTKQELIHAIQHDEAQASAPEQGKVTNSTFSKEEYERLLAENAQLRALMQLNLQGAVGASTPTAPDPGASHV